MMFSSLGSNATESKRVRSGWPVGVMRSQLLPSSVERYTPLSAPATKIFGFVGACASARTVSLPKPIRFQVRPPSSLRYTPPPPEYSVQVLAYSRFLFRGSTRMCVTTSSWPVPIRETICQCWPSSVDAKTCPSEVPRKSRLISCGSASIVITVPPGGPTCFHVCAGAAVATINATAAAPSHLPLISMPFSQSAEALSIPEFRERAVVFLLFNRTDFGPGCPVAAYWYQRWTKLCSLKSLHFVIPSRSCDGSAFRL